MFELALLIVAAVTAITLGLWVMTHLGGGLGFLLLPTLAWAALVSLVCLIDLGVDWIRSGSNRARQRRAAAAREPSAALRIALVFSTAAGVFWLGVWLLGAG